MTGLSRQACVRLESSYHASTRVETWSKQATADCRPFEFQNGREPTYCIEEGNASNSSGDIILSPERLNAPVSPSLLRRRLFVMLRRSVELGLVVMPFLLEPCRLGGVGKHSRRRVADE